MKHQVREDLGALNQVKANNDAIDKIKLQNKEIYKLQSDLNSMKKSIQLVKKKNRFLQFTILVLISLILVLKLTSIEIVLKSVIESLFSMIKQILI